MKYELPPNPYRYIIPCNSGFQVRRSLNGEVVYAGTFKTLQEAITERDFMESINWDYDNMT